MHAIRSGRRTLIAVASATLLTSLGLASSAIAIEPAGAGTGGTIVLAQAAMPKATYSNDQAKRGEVLFKDTCSDCHGDDLRGGLNGGPPLRGSVFNMHFLNSPASGLFLFMSTQMPPEAPGRFSEATYAELMAFVMQVNGFDAGAPLPSDTAKLDNLLLAK